MAAPNPNPVPKRILIQESCVECGHPIAAVPRPFEESGKKPLAPGNSQFQMELPNEIQHQNPLRCEECRTAHHLSLIHISEPTRKRQSRMPSSA